MPGAQFLRCKIHSGPPRGVANALFVRSYVVLGSHGRQRPGRIRHSALTLVCRAHFHDVVDEFQFGSATQFVGKRGELNHKFTKFVANPPKAVISDQSRTPKAISFLRLSRSAMRPMAMPTTA